MSASFQSLTVRNSLTITGATVTNGGGTLTFPTTTTTIVGRNTTDALTNKTITNSTMNDSTNTVGANNLYNGSTWTAAISGPTPTVGEVLTCTSAGILQFQTGSGTTNGSGTTTDGVTAVTLATIAIPSNTVYMLATDVVAKRTDTLVAGYAFGQKYTAAFENVSGTVTEAGGVNNFSSQVFADTNTAGLTMTYTISGTNVLVQVTGLTGITLSWNSFTTIRNV
jgi:hypothetical protein